MTELIADRTRPAVETSLRLRVRIFVVVTVVALGVVAFDLLSLSPDALLPVVLSALGGVAAGAAASRMYRLQWDHEASLVVGRIDATGVVVLVGYVGLIVFRGRLLALWIGAPVLGAAGFAALAGIMIGQVVGTLRGVHRVWTLALRDEQRRSVPGPRG